MNEGCAFDSVNSGSKTGKKHILEFLKIQHSISSHRYTGTAFILKHAHPVKIYQSNPTPSPGLSQPAQFGQSARGLNVFTKSTHNRQKKTI